MPAPLPILAVAGLAVAGMALLRRVRAPQVVQQAAQAVAGATAGAWRALDGVRLPEAAGPLLDRLAALLGFTVEVTSGIRSPWAQASAMAGKIQRGDNLYALYSQDDLVSEILAAVGSTLAPDIESMAAVIEDQVDRGRYVSRHLRGDGLDLRTTGGGSSRLSDDQITQLKAALDTLGLDWLDEGDHIHLEGLA